MTLHQVNADGAGPMACSVDTSGKGTAFQTMQITTNVPGVNGRSNVQNKDFPLVANMPAGVTACAGNVAGVSGVCFVKCQNPAGPFGGVVPVQLAAAGNGDVSTTGGGNSTTGAAAGKATGSSTTAAAGGAGSELGSKKGAEQSGKKGATRKGQVGRAVAVRGFLGL